MNEVAKARTLLPVTGRGTNPTANGLLVRDPLTRAVRHWCAQEQGWYESLAATAVMLLQQLDEGSMA